VYLSKQLDLQPPLIALHRICRRQRARQFRNPHKAHGGNKIDKTLRDADERANLAHG
jgi:hypothetical protein